MTPKACPVCQKPQARHAVCQQCFERAQLREALAFHRPSKVSRRSINPELDPEARAAFRRYDAER